MDEDLRQGDPLSYFIFLIVAKGLVRFMHKEVSVGNFHGCKLRDDLQFHTL
jgi:hypothetical protein